MDSQAYLSQAVKKIQKRLGANSVRFLSDGAASELVEVIPTGLEVLDNYVIGCGGLPVGRLTELYGAEGTGKSALSWQCVAACQKAGGSALLVETEGGVSQERAQTFGVDLHKLLVIEPETLEDTLDAIDASLDALSNKDTPNLLVWDSIAATPTESEVKDGMTGDVAIADRARLLSRACRVMAGKLRGSNVAMLWVNQTRDTIGMSFGFDKTTTPGGKAVKFHASLRICILGGKALKDEDEHVGKDVTIMAMKNRFAAPFRKARFQLNYAFGWNNTWSVVEFSRTSGIIPAKTKFSLESYAEAKQAIEELGWRKQGSVSADDDE